MHTPLRYESVCSATIPVALLCCTCLLTYLNAKTVKVKNAARALNLKACKLASLLFKAANERQSYAAFYISSTTQAFANQGPALQHCGRTGRIVPNLCSLQKTIRTYKWKLKHSQHMDLMTKN